MNRLYNLLILMRPKQWIKNFIIFIPLLFSWSLFNWDSLLNCLIIFFLFSLFVWSTYIINDYFDIEKDKKHPIKSKRPLASWKINKYFALVFSVVLISIILYYVILYYWIDIFMFFIFYLFNTVLYSIILKHKVILDVFSIALWFVIRWLIWAYIIWVNMSEWFFLIIFFWALLLWFLKRYQEVKLWIDTRKNIKEYNAIFLENIISMLVSIVLFLYTIYTFNSTQSKLFIFTLPIVVFWLIRFYYNIFFMKKYSSWIEDIVLKDKSIVFSIIIYFILAIYIIYYA